MKKKRDELIEAKNYEQVAFIRHEIHNPVVVGDPKRQVSDQEGLARVAELLVGAGGDELDLGDTIGKGTPETIAACGRSHTGRYLAEVLDRAKDAKSAKKKGLAAEAR